MTLGTKLATYRKMAGLTQQQLGERLNLSAQAISKWEKDLSEPDLTTLRTLAELYKVTVDELLDPNSTFAISPESLAEPDAQEQQEEGKEGAVAPLGFCKRCGIIVNEENLGASKPTILCKECAEEQAREEKRIKEEAARRKQEAARAEEYKKQRNRAAIRKRRTVSFVLAGLAAAVFLALMIVAMISSFSGGLLLFTLIGTYAVFGLVSCLFFDCAVQEVVVDWFDKSIHWPGLIFTFDVDGILWLIGMKLLFFFLGLLFGIVTGAIGLTLGTIIAPFVFPRVMKRVNKAIENGAGIEEVT